MKRIFLIALCLLASLPAHAADKESVYDRVMRTGAIRCGYIVWPPFFTHDAQTGAFGGMNHDYAEAVAAVLGLKIEWAADITPGTQVEALRSGKIDAMCAADGPMIPSTIKYMRYSLPMVYAPFYLYGRADEARFGKGRAAIDDPAVRIAIIDGDVSGQVANVHFPKAARYAMSQLSSPAQMMLDVADGKADILINDPLSMVDYIKANPGRLKKLDEAAIAVVPNTFSVLRSAESDQFLDMINQAMENIKFTGREAQILKPYESLTSETIFFPTTPAFKVP